jgi:hypothetical protein
MRKTAVYAIHREALHHFKCVCLLKVGESQHQVTEFLASHLTGTMEGLAGLPEWRDNAEWLHTDVGSPLTHAGTCSPASSR